MCIYVPYLCSGIYLRLLCLDQLHLNSLQEIKIKGRRNGCSLNTVSTSPSNICHMQCHLDTDSVVGLPPIDHLPEDQRCQERRRGAPAPEERGDAEHPCGPSCAETLPEIQTAKGDA